MEFDDVLRQYAGDMGVYQVLMILFVSSMGLVQSFGIMDYVFVSAVPDFHCDVGNISHLTSNLTFKEIQTLTSPSNGQGQYDTCSMYVRNYSELSVQEAMSIVIGKVNTSDHVGAVKCDKWVFSQDQYISTVATEWQLVCDKEWLLATSQALSMATRATLFIGGIMADRFGRRPISLIMMCTMVVSRLTCVLSVNYYMYTAARILLQYSELNWYTVNFFIAVEIVTAKLRVTASLGSYYFFSLGYIVTASVAYFCRSWRQLMGVLLVFVVPQLSYFCFLPESPRWLQAKKRREKAVNILEQMARINKRPIPKQMYSLKEEKVEERGILDLFKSRSLIKMTLILLYIWFVISLVYYGLFYYMPVMGGNIYINTFVTGVLELISLVYVNISLETRLGRKLNTTAPLMLCGAALLSLMLVPTVYEWLIVSLALAGKFAISATFATIYIYTSELYPTLYRASGLMVCSSVSRVGTIISPYIGLMRKTSPYLPPTLLGASAVVAGILSILLPETRGIPLPDTFSEVKHLHQQKNSEEKDQCSKLIPATVTLNHQQEVTL